MVTTRIKGKQIFDGTITSEDIDDSLEKEFTKIRVTTGDSTPDFIFNKIITSGSVSVAYIGASGSAQTLVVSGTSVIGGSDTYVQFNDGGSFGGDSGLTYNKSTQSLAIAGDLTVVGTASIGTLNTLNQQSLVIGDKYITILSGAADHVSLDGSGLLFGSGALGPTTNELGSSAHLRYRNSDDALEIFPNLKVSGSATVAGRLSVTNGISGSLTRLTDGTSYLIAGSGISVVSASNGGVTISTTGASTVAGSDTQVQFNDGGSFGGDSGLTYNKTTDTLSVVNVSMTATNDQTWNLKDNSAGALNISAGTGNNRWTFNTGDNQERLGFWDGVRASFGDINDPDLNIQHDGTNSRIENKTGTLILSSASGIDVSGSTKFANGLSGSLTKLKDGTSYLVASTPVTITTSSNGSITIGTTATTMNGGNGSNDNVITADGSGGLVAESNLNFNSSHLGITGTLGSTSLTVVSGVLYHSNGAIRQASNFMWDSTNNRLGINTSTPGRSLHVAGSAAMRIGTTTDYIDVSHAGGSTYRWVISTTLGTSRIFEHQHNIHLPPTYKIGFIPALAVSSETDSGFSRAAAGIMNVSGSAPGLIFRFNTTSTPLAAGDLGMNTSSGRPVVYTSGSVQQLAHIEEIAPVGSAFVTIGNDATLTNERSLAAGTGLSLTDGGAGSNVTLAINDSIVATVSGTTFTGATKHLMGLSGSLTKLTDGTSYLVAGSNVTISSASNGAITISSTDTTGAPVDAQYLTLASNMTLTGERVFTTGTGLIGTDTGANGSYTLAINDSVVATVSGTTFTGITKHNAGLSGSLTRLTDNTSYLIAGANVSITTGSSGAVTIVATPSGSDKQLQYNNNGSFGASSTLKFDSVNNYLTLSGSLANGNSSAADGIYSHAEGWFTIASGQYSHAEGVNSTASGNYSHAEGTDTVAGGQYSHAEGYYSTASGQYSHAEGSQTTASSFGSHSEGNSTTALGGYSHAEGNSAIAKGDYSHAEGTGTEAVGNSSHAQGYFTIASGSYQAVIGKYNKRDNNFSLLVVGDGTSDSDMSRSDILRVNSGSTGGSGRVEVTGSFAATLGLSGSLTKLTNGTSYLVGGSGISIASSSNGQVTISKDTTVGDVVGPASATNNAVALFDGTTGKLLKNSSLTTNGSDSLWIAGTLNVSGSTTFGDMTSDTVTFTARVNSDLLPSTDVSYNLGSDTNRWANIYTGDLHLKNDRGDYTLIEEEDMLTIRFNKSGKRYKFVLERVPELDEEPQR